jgi:hypothetical protein
MKEERVAIDRSSSEYSAACVKTTVAMLALSDEEVDAMSAGDGL